MPDLPHGWRMRNSEVELSGPPVEQDGRYFDDNDIDSETGEPLDIRPDSEGWNDVEDDVEDVKIKCLLCDETFPSAVPMAAHSTNAHDFDLRQIRAKHHMDFYSSIKFVNYVRAEVSAGNSHPAVDDPALWADEKFMQPTLADDALLFSLDDLDDAAASAEVATNEGQT